MTAVNLQVLVPQCTGCAYSQARGTDALLRPPDVFGPDLIGYEALGLSRRQIRACCRALEEGSWRPRCYYWCESTIDVTGEEFYVRQVDLSTYFGLDPHDGRKPPQWMKDVVLRGFDGRCAGCGKELTPDTATFDHIIAYSKEGPTEIANLQPLCQKCAGEKADDDVEVADVVLTFPLRPPPSDGFEGVIW